jgi:hypothetical protein
MGKIFVSGIKTVSGKVALKDPGLSPTDAEIGWWMDAPVERMMLVWGAYEVFGDDNAALRRKLVEEVGARRVRNLGVEREYHAACIVDGALGLKDGKSTVRGRFWSGWVKEKLSRDATLLQERGLTVFSSSSSKIPGRIYEIRRGKTGRHGMW